MVFKEHKYDCACFYNSFCNSGGNLPTRTSPFDVVNTMAADDLPTSGTRPSADGIDLVYMEYSQAQGKGKLTREDLNPSMDK